VIAKDNVQLFADAGRGAPACGPKDLVRAGTPVNVLQASGTMSQVMLLDVMWRWGQADPCPAILRGPGVDRVRRHQRRISFEVRRVGLRKEGLGTGLGIGPRKEA
jgi:hypothetical protein